MSAVAIRHYLRTKTACIILRVRLGSARIERLLRCISAGAPAHLQSGGWLAVEHGHDQAGAVQALLRQAGLEAVRSERDLQGIERVTCGRWAAAGAPTP